MTVVFLLAVIVVALTVVVGAPEYARPAVGAERADASASPSLEPSLVDTTPSGPISRLPTQLRGYRWPVRGGEIADYYDWASDGQFVIGGRRVNGGLDIEWFAGAKVKAAHRGTVLAAGTDWIVEAGFDGDVTALTRSPKARPGAKGAKGAKGGTDAQADLPLGIVIDDGNGYRSIYSNLQSLQVKKGDVLKAGTIIGEMGKSPGGRQFMRYQLVRADGEYLKVATAFRKLGYPGYAHEYVDPLSVLRLDANRAPRHDRPGPPADPPRLSDY